MSIIRRPTIRNGITSSTLSQADLFTVTSLTPEGFLYRDDLITVADEAALLATLATLPFKPFEFQGYLGKRRIVSFGWRYDFDRKALRGSDPLPAFLLPLRAKAAAFAGLPADTLQQVLINEYEPGAGVGWHRDKGMFQQVIGVSLAAPGRFRLRRAIGKDARPADWQRVTHLLQPRSAYIMRGPARSIWEHSVAPVTSLRYSITFRNFVDPPAQPI